MELKAQPTHHERVIIAVNPFNGIERGLLEEPSVRGFQDMNPFNGIESHISQAMNLISHCALESIQWNWKIVVYSVPNNVHVHP